MRAQSTLSAVFGQYAQKTSNRAYDDLATITAHYTPADELEAVTAPGWGMTPYKQGVLLGIMAARAVVSAKQANAFGGEVADIEKLNADIFQWIRDGKTDVNALNASNDSAGGVLEKLPGSLAEYLRRMAAGQPSNTGEGGDSDLPEQQLPIRRIVILGAPGGAGGAAAFDHHAYVAALSALGADVPKDVADKIAGMPVPDPSVRLDKMMKDDVLKMIVELAPADMDAFMHRLNMTVKHDEADALPMDLGGSPFMRLIPLM